MARKKIHADQAARRAAFMQDKDRFDLVIDKHLGDTIRELAGFFEASNAEVITDLVRYALTNRNWKQQGLLWSHKHHKPNP